MNQNLDRNTPAFSPQNPYRSWLVSASAGSGKTYQLSRRFLHLVAAGAEPSSILTVTFTIKAAAEMRLRILEDAARLTSDEAFAREFAASSALFHAPHKARKPPPLAPGETGALILKASQSLKITTIDAIFLEWVARFPHEAGADPAGQQTIPAPFNLANRLDEEMFRATAWKALCRHISGKLDSGDDPFLIEQLGSEKLSGLRKLIQELQSMDTYLWHEEMVSGSAFIPSDLEQVEDLPNDDQESEELLLESIEDEIRAVASVISNRGKADAILTALAERSLLGLQSATLLTKSWSLNGQTVSKKVRDQLPIETAKIEGEVLRFGDLKKLRHLNQKGELSYRLYQLYRFFYNQLRFAKNAAEFSDLVKGSFALFNSAGSLGVKYLLTRTIHHLMLDEFQDTSILQWSVFKEITDHLLAGESMDIPPGADPSLFVVGDEKQSIYGFREADPEVMTFIRESYAEQIEIAPLNESFRTANVVLSFVNNAFKGLVPDFPLHRTAEADGQPFIPNHGRVGILKTLPSKKTKAAEALMEPSEKKTEAELSALSDHGKDDTLAVAAQEAQAIASLLKHALTHSSEFPVYDKRKKTWRPLTAEDCAVLYRSGTHAGLYEEAIRRQDIPCQREEEKGFFARPEISDMLALLQYLATPADLVALLTVVKSPIASIPDPISFKALVEVQRDGQKGPVHSNEYLSALKKYRPEFVAVLADLLQSASKIPPHELILSCYRKLNVMHAYSKGPTQTENEARLAEINLIALASRALKADSEGMSTLFDVCRYFASLKELDEIGNAATAGDAVRLMTIHKSKGLEYPFLILADIGRSFAKGDINWTQVREKSGLRREDKVIFSGTKSERPLGDHWDLSRNVKAANTRTIQEAHRLLYVAVTRAQHYLFITGHEPSSGGGLKETLYHQQLLEALDKSNSRDVIINGNTYVVSDSIATDIDWKEPNAHQSDVSTTWTFAPFAKGTDPLKEELVLVSPSQLEETKGKKRLRGESGWQKLLRQEFLPPHMTAAIGTVIHRAIENVLNERRFDLSEELAKNAVTDPLSINAAGELFEKVQRSAVLATFAKQPCKTEMHVASLIGDKMVRGSIDLITEEPDGSILVVDYKTTRFQEALPVSHTGELELLRMFMRERGYDEQVKLYCETVRRIYPGKEVRGAIWFIDWDLLVE